MGDKNVVKVEVIVDEDGRAKAGFDELTRSATQFAAEAETSGAAAFQRLRDEHGRFVSATAAGAQTLSATAKTYEQDLLKAGVAAERAREEALKFQQTSQTAAGEAAVKPSGAARASQAACAAAGTRGDVAARPSRVIPDERAPIRGDDAVLKILRTRQGCRSRGSR